MSKQNTLVMETQLFCQDIGYKHIIWYDSSLGQARYSHQVYMLTDASSTTTLIIIITYYAC